MINKIFLIALLLVNTVFGYTDCDKLNDFLNSQGIQRIERCCGGSVFTICDDNNIKSLHINEDVLQNPENPISFNDFPIFENLMHLTVTARNEDVNLNIFGGYLPNQFFFQPKLEILEITRAHLNTIPWNVNTKNNIVKINLNSNDLNSFPYQFRFLSDLEELDLSRNQIQGRITNDIKDFKKLRNLNIANNQMEGEINIPNSLTTINVNNNQFNSFGWSSSAYKKLVRFEGINNNFDNGIFNSLMKAKFLKTLTLGNNKAIQNIPDDIYLLNSLENLDISGTSITTLPKNFYALSNLKYLNLANLKNLASPIVKFKREINICNFENTLPTCYQQDSCNFILGYSPKYKECSDFEIQQIHDIDTAVFRHVDQNYNVLRKVVIVFVLLLLGIIIYKLIQSYIKQHLKKKKENDKYENDDNDSKYSHESIDIVSPNKHYFRPEDDTYLSTPVYDPEKEQYCTSVVSDQQYTPYNTDITNYNSNNPLYNANPVTPAEPVNKTDTK